MSVRVLLVVIAIVIGAVTPAALARGTSEVGAVRAEYQRTALLEYFGPPALRAAHARGPRGRLTVLCAAGDVRAHGPGRDASASTRHIVERI
jgi:hypothetical protein